MQKKTQFMNKNNRIIICPKVPSTKIDRSCKATSVCLIADLLTNPFVALRLD